jgi:DNA-directed RNA polymerase specialized sigma24 family protein
MAESRDLQSFDLLLQRLAGDGPGAVGYERLRIRLIAFFRLRFPAQAEALADEAFDRLARRLADGTAVDSPEGYALGIARLLLLETQNREKKERRMADEALRDLDMVGVLSPEAEPHPAEPALRACLEGMGREAEAFILDYYEADTGTDRIARRQQLAQRLGLTLNALRNRALRMRLALESCVRARLQRDGLPRDRDGKSNSDTSGKMTGSTK